MKWKSIAAALMIGAMLTVPAYAEEGQGPQQITGEENNFSTVVQIGGEEHFIENPESTSDEASPLGIYPLSITAQQIGDVPYITKVYEVPHDTDAEQLVQSFSQDGFNFSRYDILVEELPGETETKFASKTLTFEAPSAKKEDLLPTIGHVYNYSEGGFVGQLQIDTNSISIAEEGRSSYKYTLTDTREYTGLDRNDAAYIAQTVQKNGVTLTLENVDWQVTGSTPVDGGYVPNRYNAVATYTGTATGSKVTGYIATVLYTGEVEQRMPAMKRVSVIYRGELPAPEPAPAETLDPTVSAEAEGGHFFTKNLPFILLTAIGALALAGFGAFWIIRKYRRKRWMRNNAAQRGMIR